MIKLKLAPTVQTRGSEATRAQNAGTPISPISPVPPTAPAPAPQSLASLLSKSTVQAGTKPAPSTQSRLLHGSGLTKKLFSQAAKAAVKETEPTAQMQVETIAPTTQEQDNLLTAALPSTLIDPNLQLDPFQLAAIHTGRQQKYFCLIGRAGTGKTTTAKQLIRAVEEQMNLQINPDSCLTLTHPNAPTGETSPICMGGFTGRSVQQLKRAMPKQYHSLCETVHSILGYAPTYEDYEDSETKEYRTRRVFRPTYGENCKLPYKFCIIDEASMLPINLFNELVAALPTDCRIILMGDINQLPPVIGRSVLGFAMLKWPTSELTKLHRNAGPIAENAHLILEGKFPRINPQQFQMLELPPGGFDCQRTICGIVQKLHKLGKFDPLQDALIVPQNVGTIGQEALNGRLVQYFNPPKTIDNLVVNKRQIITAGYDHLTLAAGDKIMLLQNDKQRGLTNGMIGVVQSIVPNAKFQGESIADHAAANAMAGSGLDLSNLHDDVTAEGAVESKSESDLSQRAASHVTTIMFQNMKATIDLSTAGDYKRIAHAYAFTCHKAQGGEYPTAVVVCHSANSIMLSREWLYTAVTRAKQRVILLYNRAGLTKALSRQIIKGSTLEEKAKSFLLASDTKDTQIPNLRPPETLACIEDAEYQPAMDAGFTEDLACNEAAGNMEGIA